MTLEDTRQTLENIINSDPVLRDLFSTRSPSYRYFHHKGSKDQYFWTTEAIKYNGKLRFVSGIYRYLKTQNLYRLTNATYHAKRKDAKARALQLWESGLTANKEASAEFIVK
mgnify:CR=1 FL=1